MHDVTLGGVGSARSARAQISVSVLIIFVPVLAIPDESRLPLLMFCDSRNQRPVAVFAGPSLSVTAFACKLYPARAAARKPKTADLPLNPRPLPLHA
jgi:hypothetical protein